MLYCTLILLKGEGTASLKCKTQPHVGTAASLSLHDLPVGGTLVVGDGFSHHAATVRERHERVDLPPLAHQTIWAAYLSPEGALIAWGTSWGGDKDSIAPFLYEMAPKEPAVAREERVSRDLDGDAPPAVSSPQRMEETPAPVAPETPLLSHFDEDVGGVLQAEDFADATEDPPAEPADSTAREKDDAPREAVSAEEETPLSLADVAPLLEQFEELPPYLPLQDLVVGSRWVRVPSGDGAYLLGLLYDSTPALTHVCYGVEGRRDLPFSATAEWLDGKEDSGEGYWLVYHRVDTY